MSTQTSKWFFDLNSASHFKTLLQFELLQWGVPTSTEDQLNSFTTEKNLCEFSIDDENFCQIKSLITCSVCLFEDLANHVTIHSLLFYFIFTFSRLPSCMFNFGASF